MNNTSPSRILFWLLLFLIPISGKSAVDVSGNDSASFEEEANLSIEEDELQHGDGAPYSDKHSHKTNLSEESHKAEKPVGSVESRLSHIDEASRPPKERRVFMLLGFHERWVRDASGNQYNRETPNSFSMGWGNNHTSLGLEIQNSVTDSGYGAVKINKQQWGFLGLISVEKTKTIAQSISPFLIAGIGAFQEKISTNFMGTSTQQSSSWSSMGAAGIGMKVDFNSQWRLQAELRFLFSPDFNPSAFVEMPLRLGFVF